MENVLHEGKVLSAPGCYWLIRYCAPSLIGATVLYQKSWRGDCTIHAVRKTNTGIPVHPDGLLPQQVLRTKRSGPIFLEKRMTLLTLKQTADLLQCSTKTVLRRFAHLAVDVGT